MVIPGNPSKFPKGNSLDIADKTVKGVRIKLDESYFQNVSRPAKFVSSSSLSNLRGVYPLEFYIIRDSYWTICHHSGFKCVEDGETIKKSKW